MIEALLGLSLTLGILVSSLGFLNVGRKVFFKLKGVEEERLAVLASLEKIRMDVARAGQGLADPVGWGLLSGLITSGNTLTVESLERRLTLLGDITAGASRIDCSGTEDLAANRVVCVFDDDKGELATVTAGGRGFISLAAPIQRSYDREECQVAVVGSVKYFLQAGTLRRQANNSSAQPLLDDVGEWEAEPGASPWVVSMRLRLKGKERIYALSVVCKNMALSSAGR